MQLLVNTIRLPVVIENPPVWLGTSYEICVVSIQVAYAQGVHPLAVTGDVAFFSRTHYRAKENTY